MPINNYIKVQGDASIAHKIKRMNFFVNSIYPTSINQAIRYRVRGQEKINMKRNIALVLTILSIQ